MRISLTQTILLSTALLTMNLPLSAMEVTDEVSQVAASAASEIPAKEYSFLKALGIPTLVDGSTEDRILKQTLALLTDEAAVSARAEIQSTGKDKSEELLASTNLTSSVTVLDQTVASLDDLEEQFNAYKSSKVTLPLSKSVTNEGSTNQEKINALSLTWKSSSTGWLDSITSTFTPSEFNAPYQALFDNLYALTEPSSIQIALTRIDNANKAFGEIITKRRQAVAEFVKRNGTTPSSAGIIQRSTQDLLALKIKEQNRFKRALFDFILTRELFFNLSEDKKTYQEIISANAATKFLIPNLTAGQQDSEQSANNNIPYICKALLQLEAFIKSTYSFSRSWLPTTTNKIAIGARTATKQKRLNMTGVDTLPDNVLMTLLSDAPESIKINDESAALKTEDSSKIDPAIMASIKSYMEILLSDSYALQDAVVANRITYLTAEEVLARSAPLTGAQDTRPDLQADSKPSGDGVTKGASKEKADEVTESEPVSSAIVFDKDAIKGETPSDVAGSKEVRKYKKDKKKKDTETAAETVIENDNR